MLDRQADRPAIPRSRGDADGVTRLVGKAGAPGKTKIKVKGKGPNLRFFAPPYTGPVTVEVTRALTPMCWSATYSAPTHNDTTRFSGKSD